MTEQKFNWSEEVNFRGEVIPKDLMDRAKYAEALSQFISAQAQVNPDFVLNIDAQWGAGKTYFIKRWAAELEASHPVVYVDAWKYDYSDDPFMTVVHAIYDQLDVGTYKEKVRSLKKGVLFCKRLLPALTKGVIKKATGCDPEELSFASISADASGVLMQEFINQESEQVKAIEGFKEDLTELINKAHRKKKYSSPTYIFIDELDRCRPTYAIEMLEIIKHLFSVPSLVFVVSTDTRQLQHSISSVYGYGFDSVKYLDRFFSQSISLPKADSKAFIENSDFANTIDDYIASELLIFPFGSSKAQVLTTIDEILIPWDAPLRTIAKILDRLNLALSSLQGKKLIVDLNFLAFLMAAKCLDQSTYEKLLALSRRKHTGLDALREASNDKLPSSREISISYQDNWIPGTGQGRLNAKLTELLAERMKAQATKPDEGALSEAIWNSRRNSATDNQYKTAVIKYLALSQIDGKHHMTIDQYRETIELTMILN